MGAVRCSVSGRGVLWPNGPELLEKFGDCLNPQVRTQRDAGLKFYFTQVNATKVELNPRRRSKGCGHDCHITHITRSVAG